MDNGKLGWKLEENLQVVVLSFLPWHETMRLRVVCGKWNQLLTSREFRQKWRGRQPNQMPFCFMGSKDYGTTFYNPVVDKWQDVGRSFITFKMDEGVYKAPDVRVMGAARGLILLQVLLSPGYAAATPHSLMHDLFVMNPLEPSRKKKVNLLAHLQHPNTSSILGMVWNDTTQSHQILLQYHPEGLIFNDVSSQDSRMWTFYSYDVESELWDQISRWPRDRYRDFQSASLSGGKFQCLAKMCNSSVSYGSTAPSLQRFRVYAPDESDENWLREPTWVELGDPEAPSLPYPLHFALLFQQEHETFVAGGEVTFSLEDQTDECIALHSFRLWKFHHHHHHEEEEGEEEEEEVAGAERSEDRKRGRNRWVEIHQMPTEIVASFRKGVNMQFSCAANERFVIVSNWLRDCAVLDMHNMKWLTLPPQPNNSCSAQSPIREELFDLFYLHLCEPRLDVVL